MKRQIILLALSWRDGGICVAGRDIHTKEWIRPVTLGGAVPKWQVSEFRLADVIELETTRHVPVHHQIENYLFVDKLWKKVAHVNKSNLKPYLETPANIWNPIGAASVNGLTPSEIKMGGIKYSLLFIALTEMAVRHQQNEFDGKITDKYYGIFEYNKIKYKFSITDPAFTAKFPDLKTYTIKDTMVCCSLAEEFKEMKCCYKLIAGVIY